jgi:hypothetical protein
VGAFVTGEPEIGVSWENDRSLFLTRWLDADELPSIWRLTIDGGQLARVVTIPAGCVPLGITLGGAGRTATCRVDDFRSDIWLMRVPGVTR